MKLVKPAIGPLIDLPEEEKKRINTEVDQKMAELEATGLSREEILLTTSRVLPHSYLERHSPCFRPVFPIPEAQLLGSRNLPKSRRTLHSGQSA